MDSDGNKTVRCDPCHCRCVVLRNSTSWYFWGWWKLAVTISSLSNIQQVVHSFMIWIKSGLFAEHREIECHYKIKWFQISFFLHKVDLKSRYLPFARTAVKREGKLLQLEFEPGSYRTQTMLEIRKEKKIVFANINGPTYNFLFPLSQVSTISAFLHPRLSPFPFESIHNQQLREQKPNYRRSMELLSRHFRN